MPKNENRNLRDGRVDRMGHRMLDHPMRRNRRGAVSLVIAAVLAAILVIILDL